MTEHTDAQKLFERQLAAARTPDVVYAALNDLTHSVVGAKLFTIMTIDMSSELARRAFTSDPDNYPTSGTKPVERNSWFAVVHDRQDCFVANTIDEIAKVFPDHQLISSLCCRSVINLPVVINRTLVATVNMLHEENHYTDKRVQLAKQWLTLPSLAAISVARLLA